MKEQEEGQRIVERLVSAISELSCSWVEFVGEDLAHDVRLYLGWEEDR